jgi:hypothetical protein
MGLATAYRLTPADIADIRALRRQGRGFGSPDGNGITDVPYLVCSPSDGTLYLHSRGRGVIGGMRPEVMCALLLAERLEPGFVDRIADPSCTVEEALRSPVDRAAAQERLKAAQAAERARTAAKADENRRRSRQLTSDPKLASLTLADLTKTL